MGIPYDANVMYPYVQECEQVILNYCQIEEVPAPLKYTIANMSIDLFNFDSSKKSGDGTSIHGDITSIKIGDTTTSFGTISGSSDRNIINSHKADLDDLLLNYRQQLNQFRKMW